MPSHDQPRALLAVLAEQQVPQAQLDIVSALAAAGLTVATRLREMQASPPPSGGASTNRFGDTQTPLDVLTDRLFRDELSAVSAVGAVATEESAVTLAPPTGDAPAGRFLVVLDPLDGSKNFSVGGPLGSIFGVLRDFVTADEPNHGIGDVAFAGYIMYSWVPVFVIATAAGVTQFTADASLTGFFESGTISLPADGSIYAVNEGHRASWSAATRAAVERFTTGRSLRYTGCFVADVHRVLSEGGIYAYPPTESHPTGKLRLFYEVIPLGYVVRAAGGAVATTDGMLEPHSQGSLDDTSVVYIGSTTPVTQAITGA